MERIYSKLTVFFDEPFWIGVYEREGDDRYEACRVVFGAEPKDYEIYHFLMLHWNELKFSPSIEGEGISERKINPKRMKRSIQKQLQCRGAGTKAQQALQLQQEQNKIGRKEKSRQKREEQKERKFEQRQLKRKEKHRGH